MPRNGSGTMSVQNSFSSGTTIQSSSVNANFTDLASEITNSLPRDGQAGMSGPFKAASGSVSAPSLAFSSDTDTGFYLKTPDTIGIIAGGAEVATIGTSGLVDVNSNVIVGIPAGAMMMYGAITAPTGWLRCNGRTIGNASSVATERANADTSTLFSFLWTNYANSVCAVSSGRGASAAADYAANKTIALPDLRGRAFFGLDDMGNTASSRLGSIITSQTTNGASGGAETVTLTQSQLPAVAPTGSVATTLTPNPHNHTVTSVSDSTVGTTGGGAQAYVTARTTSSVTLTATSTFTGNAIGSGSAHSNMPPAFLTTFIIKL